MRRYSKEEIDRHFGDRDHFSSMTSDEVANIFQYISARFNVPEDQLNSLVDPQSKTVDMLDSQVYAALEDMELPSVEEVADAQFKTRASIVSKCYKGMCKKHNFNFKQPIISVMDFGCDNRLLQTSMKHGFFAKYAIGIEVDKYSIDECQDALGKLRQLKDGQIDIINCDSILHSVSDQSMREVLDEFVRVCGKYIFIKDFELGDDYALMKEFAISRELASGVLADSHIPDLIASDPDHIADPSMYYNQEFSIERVIKYLTTEHFEIVHAPQLKKSIGNPRVYVLKSVKFKPWILGETNVATWSGGKHQDVQSFKNKLFEQAHSLKGKATAIPTRDEKQKQITILLNKISILNYQDMCKRLVTVFSTVYQTISAGEQQEFIEGIAARLVSRARSCRNLGAVFASIYKDLAEAENFISGTSYIYTEVEQECLQFIQTILHTLDANLQDYEDKHAELVCVTSFISNSLEVHAIPIETVLAISKQLYRTSTLTKENVEYVACVVNLVECIYNQDQALGKRIVQSGEIDIKYIADHSQGRSRCIALNLLQDMKL